MVLQVYVIDSLKWKTTSDKSKLSHMGRGQVLDWSKRGIKASETVEKRQKNCGNSARIRIF